MHVPFTFVNYAIGTTSMRAFTFWWSTQLGLLPGCILFVWAGAELPTLQELMVHGTSAIFTPRLMVVFVLMAVFPIIVRRFVRETPAGQSST